MSKAKHGQRIEPRFYISEAARNVSSLTCCVNQVEQCAHLLIQALRGRQKIMFCGNGGSAAQAQHLAAELSGRFLLDRSGLPGISLTTDTSAITAIANDYGYENIFARQVAAIGVPGDVLFCISTSGNSKNLVQAIKKAREIGVVTVALIGPNECEMLELADLSIRCGAKGTNFIQEQQFVLGHLVCALVEQELFL